ncbi:MAG: NAD(P)/FAD-dependent oxidoreductase [Candidatus Babeliaceae bacterium]
MVYDYDLMVLGAGSAGLTAAKLARSMGKTVVLIEKNKLGGTCTLDGCIPSKTLVNSALMTAAIKNCDQIGLQIDKNTLNTHNVLKHVRTIINEIYEQDTPELLEKAGIQVIIGNPHFENNHHIVVNNQTISANRIIIATGARPCIPGINGLDSVEYLTYENIFNLEKLPQSIIILGGGPIGMEMACALNNLGVRVTVVEKNAHILSHDDQEITHLLLKHSQKKGIIFQLESKATHVRKEHNQITVTCSDAHNNTFELSAESLLIALGRTANVEELGLEHAGVKFNTKGIITNNTLQTTAKNIYACGDVVGPYQFSHVAGRQAIIATHNAFISFFKKKFDDHDITWVTFTDPTLATAGLTEEQAHARYGTLLDIYTVNYTDMDRAYTDNVRFGTVKIICKKNGEVVGASILGERAGELLHEIQLGKYFKIPFYRWYEVLHAYPTYSDLIRAAAKKAYVEHVQKNFWIKFLHKLKK